MYEQPRCDIFAVSTPWQSRFVGRDKIAVDRRWHNRCGVTYYGATMSWKASDNIRFYGHIAREKGDHYTQDYSVSLGMKYSFW